MGRNWQFLSLYGLGLVYCSLDLGSLARQQLIINFLEKGEDVDTKRTQGCAEVYLPNAHKD